jgi:NMD protein affecting ribosome stability and mRNA decay
MKRTHAAQRTPASGPRRRRIAGRAQQDHLLDPYQGHKKLRQGTACPQCGAVFHAGRWQWGATPEGAAAQLCAACRRINDRFPAGIATFRGDLDARRRTEIRQLAQHQEEVEKREHPLNRIMSIEETPEAIVINTTDIHLPRRIAEAVQRALHGAITAHFEEDGYFLRIEWTPPAA